MFQKMKITLVTSTIPMEPLLLIRPLPAASPVKSTQISSNQLKSAQINSNQLKSAQIGSNERKEMNNLVSWQKKNGLWQACKLTLLKLLLLKLLLQKLLLQATLVNCSLASEAALNFSSARPTCAISVLLIRSWTC